MPKNQTNLDSFFGVSKDKKITKNPQTKLDSFFGKQNAEGNAEKENNKRSSEGLDNQSGKKDAANKPDKIKISADAKRRRRVIDDDSDDDDAEVAPVEEETPFKKESEDKDAEEANTKVGDSKAKRDDVVVKDEEMADAAPKKDDSKVAEKASGDKNIKDEHKGGDKKVSGKKTNKKSKATTTTAESKKKPSSGFALASTSSLPYSELCEAFDSIQDTTKRLQIQEIITNLFRKQIDSGNPDNLYPLMYLCSNSVAPAYECVELGIGDSLLQKAIAEAYGSSPKVVKNKYEEDGDLGLVAQKLKGKQRTIGGFFTATKKTAKKQWSCQEILTALRDIAAIKGGQSQKLKTDKIKKLLVGATHNLEPKYIIRALQGKLRIGLAQTTVLISCAHALALSVPSGAKAFKDDQGIKSEEFPEEARTYKNKSTPDDKRLEAAAAIIKKAYNEVSSYDALLDAALSAPLEFLHIKCTLTPGMPVQPMLAKPTKSLQEVLKRLSGQCFTAEYKYDGERAQVHMLPDGSTKVFSRNLLDTSEKYPEVQDFLRAAAHDTVKSCVCDTEVVAYDSKKGKLVPFQVLSTRKKSEESSDSAKVKVIVQAFDLMYLNGQSLLSLTLRERRELMRKHFSAVEGKFSFAVSVDHEENGDTLVLEEFLDLAVKGQCEGLMVKTLDDNAIYEPSKRSLNWLKLKKDYLEGMGDSVDLVPIGAYHGKGKRKGTFGAYLLACYDPDTEEFQSVCKIGTGFSDEDLQSLAEGLNKHVIPKKTSQYNVTDQLECDVWFDAVQVWEVKAADLSKSSTHRGAVGQTGEEGRGIGLRFPRFERPRPDKRPVDATTSHQVLDMYYNQDSVKGGGNGDDDDDDDGI